MYFLYNHKRWFTNVIKEKTATSLLCSQYIIQNIENKVNEDSGGKTSHFLK